MVAVLAVLVLHGCAVGSAAVPIVDLELREPIPSIGEVEPHTLRIGVAAVLSPEGTVESYAELADYLGEQLDRPAELVQRRTYAEVNALIDAGDVDLAFVCTSAYVRGRASGSTRCHSTTNHDSRGRPPSSKQCSGDPPPRSNAE